MSKFDVVAFDADDTLWQNEHLYARSQAGLVELLANYHPPEWVNEHLYQAEMRNLEHFGYGVKAFALSMIETAVELTEGRISGGDLQTLVDMAREMLHADVDLLDHVEDTLALLREKYTLMMLTKGDLFEQENKIARSGLGDRFHYIEIVSMKTLPVYKGLLERHSIQPGRFLMVGNSLRSDILPLLELGAYAVFIPHELTWQHENSDSPPAGQAGFYRLEHIGQLPELLERLEKTEIN
ncbi:MAG: HAD family hydrolase [Anaerolineales bacterium]